LTGAAIDGIADADLPPVALRTDVFARANPEHKLRIVRALQSRGAIVAMTGDGVNDAPSLKQADVGIAMGRKGTEAAKEASQMVLVDDNFASIVAAVHEGRTVYDNIRKVIGWTLPSNGGEVLSVIVAVLFALPLPMLAVHILWINLVTTVTLGMVLAFEPPEPGVMRRPPRRRDEALASGFLLWRIVFVSVLFMLGTFAVFEYAMQRGLGEDGARTMVVNLIVVMEIFYLFNVRYLHMTSFSLRGAAGTPAVLAAIAVVVVAQAAFTYLPFMHRLFDSRPVGAVEIAVMIGIGLAIMIVLEIEKGILRRLQVFDELRR
ncbi:MAG: HAD-IC family P-type ATPase, partial [Burkholderiaceae bacterium]